MNATLYYAHDPMCSWCWGFKPTWLTIKSALSTDVQARYILGGLAPDSDEPMPEQMQSMLQQTWQRIAQNIPGTEFNFDFWTKNKPRRSTYPACRAVIAARTISSEFEEPMILAIQTAYYLNAQNPSDAQVLVALAGKLGCDEQQFKGHLQSDMTNQTLNEEIQFARRIGAQGFPSLFLHTSDNKLAPVDVNYTDSAIVVDQIRKILAA